MCDVRKEIKKIVLHGKCNYIMYSTKFVLSQDRYDIDDLRILLMEIVRSTVFADPIVMDLCNEPPPDELSHESWSSEIGAL